MSRVTRKKLTAQPTMTAKANASFEFHLFVEEVLAESGDDEKQNRAEPLMLASGPARLGRDAAGRPALAFSSGEGADAGAWLEPLTGREAQPRLLLLSPPESCVRINGLRAPPIAILSAKDRFSFDASCTFRVAIYYRPKIGLVPSDLVGAACPVCTIPLLEGDRCLICCHCGIPLHAAEDESVPGALACAGMASECPRCQHPVRLVPGYSEGSEPTYE